MHFCAWLFFFPNRLALLEGAVVDNPSPISRTDEFCLEWLQWYVILAYFCSPSWRLVLRIGYELDCSHILIVSRYCIQFYKVQNSLFPCHWVFCHNHLYFIYKIAKIYFLIYSKQCNHSGEQPLSGDGSHQRLIHRWGHQCCFLYCSINLIILSIVSKAHAQYKGYWDVWLQFFRI